VLCLHGLGGDHRGLAEFAAALPGVNVVIPDLPGYGRSAPMSDPHSLVNYAAALAMPVLLLTGTRDGIAPAAAVTALARRVPNATLTVLPDVGHLVPMEQPTEIASLVDEFLKKSTVD